MFCRRGMLPPFFYLPRSNDNTLSDFINILKHADQVIADLSVLMQTAEVPLAVQRIVHDGVEENIEIVDRSVAVDHPLDGRGRFMGDDDIESVALFLDIDDGVFQLFITRQGGRGFRLIHFGWQTSAQCKDLIALDQI